MARKSRDSPYHGLLLVDKPAGWTSHDVVAKVRGLTRQRRIGHGGTLDPAATGLLVLFLGKATRLAEYLTLGTKSYTGTIRLGVRTTTDDLEGDVVETAPVPPLGADDLERVAGHFTGSLNQRPPAFSAVHVDGRRAYDIARAGEQPALAERPVTVHSLSLVLEAPDTIAIGLTCTAGTYVRSLARDIGDQLGCGAALATLRRTASSHLRVEDALTLDAIAALAADGTLAGHLLPADEATFALPAAIVGTESAQALVTGISRLVAGAPPDADPLRLYDSAGTFLGIGRLAESALHPRKILI